MEPNTLKKLYTVLICMAIILTIAAGYNTYKSRQILDEVENFQKEYYSAKKMHIDGVDTTTCFLEIYDYETHRWYRKDVPCNFLENIMNESYLNRTVNATVINEWT